MATTKSKAERDVGSPASIATCLDCEWACAVFTAAHGAAARHAAAFGHRVRVEVARALCYYPGPEWDTVPDMDWWWEPALCRAARGGYKGRPNWDRLAMEWPDADPGSVEFAGEVYALGNPEAVEKLRRDIRHLEETALGQASGIARCEFCAEPYYRRVPRHRFCSEICRGRAVLAALESSK